MATPSPSPRGLTLADVEADLAARGMDVDHTVELIGGTLLERPDMAPQSPQHSFLVAFMSQCLADAVRDLDFHVRSQSPVVLDAHNAPEPDVAIIRGRAGVYAQRHPGQGEILLAVEVAWTSTEYDRRKAPLYSRLGCGEYWIAHAQTNVLQVYRGPDGRGEWSDHETVKGAYRTNIENAAISWPGVADID